MGYDVTLVGAGITVTLHRAVLLLEVLTVIVAVPAFFAVILPFVTEATVVLLLDHMQDWLAFDG